MNTTRNGKIARLPRTIRDQLSQRIDNAEPGRKLMAWLNSLPEVQSVLAEQFEGRPINEQNITEWRQGGYQDWLELQENRTLTLELVKDAATLEQDHNQQKMTDAFATITAAGFIRTARAKLKACTDLDQRWKHLGEIESRLSRIQRNQCRASHLAICQQRWAAQAEDRKRVLDDAADAEDRRQKLLYFELQPEVKQIARNAGDNFKSFGLSTFLLEMKHNLPTGYLTQKPAKNSEGRVVEPSIGQVPNIPDSPAPVATPDARPGTPNPTSGFAPIPKTETQDPRPESASIALANDVAPLPAEIRLEDHEKMPGIRVNQAAGECSKNHELN